MTKGANQGAYAEGKVREFLKGWAETHAGFCFNRILDAHSAMGAMANPQPGDFQWFLDTGNEFIHHDEQKVWSITRNGLIEVKSVKHAFRLPYKNFGSDQVGRMRIRELAGSEPLVLVCHRPEGGKVQWRNPPLDFIAERVEGAGSWDLSGFPAHPKVSDILEKLL